MKENCEFVQLLDRVKDSRRITDEEIAAKLEVGATYISQIRRGKKHASAKLTRRLKLILSGQDTSTIQPQLPWDEIVKADVERFARSCGMSAPTFIVECLRRSAEKTADQVRSEVAAKQRKAAEISSTLKPARSVDEAASDLTKSGAKEFDRKPPTDEPSDEASGLGKNDRKK